MNYLQEIIAFSEYKSINLLSAGQISLWYALMEINNKCAWTEWFSVSNTVLEARSGITQKAIYNAREVLKERGLIDFKYNGKKATMYKMNSLVKFRKKESYSTNEATYGSANETTNVGSNDTTGYASTLNKQNKTKQNKNYYNKNSIRKSPLNNYDDENADDYKELEDSIIQMMLSDEY